MENHGKSLRRLAALKTLKVNGPVHNLHSIAKFNRKLISLNVYSVLSSLDSGLKLNSLKHLGEAYLGGADVGHWLSLIKNCSNIETFEFSHRSYLATREIEDYLNVIDDLMNNPTIRHLTFKSDRAEKLFAVLTKGSMKRSVGLPRYEFHEFHGIFWHCIGYWHWILAYCIGNQLGIK